jgi:DNA-binding response OmpR family regulator
MQLPQNKNDFRASASSCVKDWATILIIEDDSGLRFLLERSMKQGNYQTISMADGTAALETLAEHSIDLVLLDIAMANGNSFTVCREIRRHYQIPILVLSALNALEAQEYANHLGADAYLTKPVRLADLHFCVQSLLESTKAQPSI